MKRRIFLDTCSLIYLTEGSLGQRQRLFRQLESVASEVVSSELVRLECRVVPLRRGDDDLLAHYDRFFDSPIVQVFPITQETFELATRLRAGRRLATADALHVATALHAGCDEFWTNDDKLSAVSDRLRVVIAR